MDREYIAFISYRHAPLDSAVAKTVHSLVEQYRIPRSLRRNGAKKFGYVFRDQEELPVSSDLSEDIRRALDHARYLIVICSAQTKKSPWVSREIAYFLEHHDRNCVFAVLASGEPGEVFPRSLTQVVGANGTVTEVEPLALDARGDSQRARKKKLRKEILRLYAAMLGCPYDKLVLRQQRRKARKATAVAAAVLAAALSFSGLLFVKNQQIAAKNRDLEQQKQQLQLRESELLTRDAREALARGDYAAAVQNAVAALPGAGEDRPYYAQAEAALIEALGLLDDSREDYIVTETVLPAAAPVVDMRMHSNGKTLVAADQYSVVTCFDTQSGQQLWSRQLDTDPAGQVQLLPCGDEMLLGIRAGGVTALSWQDGGVLWQYENAFLSDQAGVLSADGKYLAVLDWRMTPDFIKYEFYLQVLSTADGSQISRVKLAEGMSLQATQELPYVSFPGVLGDFSDDGSAFAGTYLWEDASGQEHVTYYRADLTESTAQAVYTCALSDDRVPVRVDFGKRECTVVFRNELSKVALTVETVDCHSGTRLWQVQTPAESSWFDSGDQVICIRKEKLLYMTRADMLYVIDMTDGAPVHYRSMGANILAVQPVDDRFFAFLTADGTYTLAWHNDSGVYHSAEVFDQALHVGSGETALLWGESLLQMTEEGDRYTGAVTVPGGCLAVLLEEETTSISVRRVLLLEDLPAQMPTQLLPEGAKLISGNAVLLGGGRVAFGVVDIENANAIALLGDERGLLEGVSHHNMEHLAVLPDASGYISYYSWGEDLTLHDGSGNTTVLMEQYGDVLYQADDTSYGASHWAFTVGYAENGDVLAAVCDASTLYLWRNAKPWQQIALPADVQFALASNTQYYRYLALCGHKVLLSHFDDTQDFSVDAVAVYDLAAGRWSKISCADLPLAEARLACGSTGAFALLDDADVLHIYDENGTRTGSLPAPVPHGAVDQLDFILEDRYLLIKTSDQQLLILDSVDGAILLHQRIDGDALSRVHVFADAVNNRLYLCDSKNADDEGLCLDMGSWTVLARIPGLLCYDPQQDVIYRYAEKAGDILRCRLPSTQELVSYCQQAFDLDAEG